MEIIDFDNICRICWNDSFLRTVFNEDIPSLCEMLMACAPLEVCQENGLPTKICENCSSDLEKAYAFREKCIQSEIKFRKYFDDSAVIITDKSELAYEPETVIVMEEFGEDAYLATNENGETTLIQASSLDPSIKASLEAATLEGKATTTVITTDENGTVIEDDTTLKDVTIITEDESEEIDISNMLEFQDSTDEIIETTVTAESEEQQSVKKFACHLCEREYLHPRNLKRHVREDHSGKMKIPISGTRNYRCSICRRIFSFKNALIRHLRVVHRDITKNYFMVKNGKKCCSKEVRIFFENAQEPAKEVKGILGEIENYTDDADDTDDDYSDNLSEHAFQFSSVVINDDENKPAEVKIEPEFDNPPGGKILQTLLLTKSGKQKIKHAPDSRRGQKVKVVKNLNELKDQMEKKNTSSKKTKKDNEDQTVFVVEEGIFKNIFQSQEDSQEEAEIKDEVDDQKPQFVCDLCGKLFTIRSNLKRHLNMVHRVAEKVRDNDEFNYSSTVTDEVIEEIRNEQKGYEEDVNEDGTKTKKYQCDMCERSYYAKNNLKRHIKEKHLPKEPTPDREFMCELCGRAFARKGLLERHKDSHLERQGHQCEQCGEVFPKKGKLSQHVIKHQREKKYQCDVCGKWFLRPATLKIHKRLHDPVLPYPCTVCSRAFSMKPALEAHMRTHSSERPFICSYCRRAFRHPGHLDTHMKLHTGERPFGCNMCTKRFTTTTHLKYHIKVHLGQRDYKCEYCDRAFINRSELKYHLVSHTQIKTCPCSICGKMFGRTYQVTKHMRQVHKIRKNFFAPAP